MAVSCSLLVLFTPNLEFCKTWSALYDYCGSIVANPIIYRLVPSPSRMKSGNRSQKKSKCRKAPGKGGHIVAEHKMNVDFPCCANWETFVADTKCF